MQNSIKLFFSLFLLKTKRRTLLFYLFLVFWVAINCLLGNWFYAFFILVFFLLLVLIRVQSISFLLIPVIVIIFLNTPIVESWIKIITVNTSMVEHPSIPINNIFTPNTGLTKDVLDRKIIWMLSMIQKYDLQDYRLTNSLVAEGEVSQSIVESAWPIKFEFISMNVFLRVEEIDAFPDCRVDEIYNMELAFVRCP